MCTLKNHYQIDRDFELNLLLENISVIDNQHNYGKILYNDISKEGSL